MARVRRRFSARRSGRCPDGWRRKARSVSDHRYGEELCVWIRRREGATLSEDEVIAFCRASIAHYKAPRYVRFVDAFPMTVTGKAQKYLMRRAMMEELALAEEKTA
jgi:fatty-acyl-CoA synthase